MAYGAILGQTPDLGAYANSVQLTTTGSSTYTLTLPDGTDIVSGVNEALGLPNTFTRMQIVSYVGTGTYGESNPCSITADFPIKTLFFIGMKNDYYGSYRWIGDGNIMIIPTEILSVEYQEYIPLYGQEYNSSYMKISSDRKTVYWYNTDNDDFQLNNTSNEYYFICFG